MKRLRADIAIYLVSALFIIGAISIWWHGVWPSSSVVALEPAFPDGTGADLGGSLPDGQGGPLGPGSSGSGGSGSSGPGFGGVGPGGPGYMPGSGDDPSEGTTIVVHVAGAVLKPGIYELREGQRVHDAIELAEASSDADLDLLNLAAVLRDSDKVYVPRKGEGFPPGWTGGSGAGSGGSAGYGGSGGSSGSSGSGVRFPININTATASELDALPGIGPSLANAIITYRNKNGPFAAPHDIVGVPGIAEKKYEQMADLIVIR
jgi:competence protein ComEA